jgi:integrase/recombinase XerD
VVVGFYRVCVIDQILAHSPADYVRRPVVPPESPTLGLAHLQFEALLSATRLSANPNDFALVALLGLLGLRIFEACGAITDLGEEHGHRVLRVHGKGGKVVLVPLPPAVARAIDRAVDDRAEGPILRNTLGAPMDRHGRLKHLATTAGIRIPWMHPHMQRHTFVTSMLDAGVSLRDVRDRRPPRRPPHHHALRPSPQKPRPPPQLHPRRVHGLPNVAGSPRVAEKNRRKHTSMNSSRPLVAWSDSRRPVAGRLMLTSGANNVGLVVCGPEVGHRRTRPMQVFILAPYSRIPVQALTAG